MKKQLNSKLGFIFMIAALIFFFIGTVPGAAQTPKPVIIRIIPVSAQVALNQTIDIAVEAQDIQDLYGIDILLEFDPQALSVVDMDTSLPGTQVLLGTLLEPGFVLLNQSENELGRVRLAMTQLNPAVPKNGTGTLMVVRFLAKELKQDTVIGIRSIQIATNKGSLITVDQIDSAKLSVVSAVAGPTNTPIPAQPAGTPMPTPTKTLVPTAVPTQAAVVATQIPTPIPTQAEQTVPVATEALATLSATAENAAATEQAGSGETAPQEKATAINLSSALADPQAEAKNTFNPLWIIVPGLLIGGSALALVFLGKRKHDEI